MVSPSQVYKNRKNNLDYQVLCVAVDMTNGRCEGQICVVYHRIDEDVMYVREREEFLRKFDLLDTEVKIG